MKNFSNIQLENDLFLRDLLVRVSRKRAVLLTLITGSQWLIYVTSIDDKWIRGCEAEPMSSHQPVWINREHVVTMEDTEFSYVNRLQYTKEKTKDIGFYCAPIHSKAKDAIDRFSREG